MGSRGPEFKRLAELAGLSQPSLKRAKSNRLIRLKGYGNAINPIVAAEFILAYLEAKKVMAGVTPS